MAAGKLTHRLSFQNRALVSDGYGNEEASTFTEMFVRWAQIQPSAGIETVNAARLQGQQPVDIIVYRDSETLDIAADWQAVDLNEGTIYALTSPPMDVWQNRKKLMMKARTGVAA